MAIGICYLIFGLNMFRISKSKNITNNNHIRSIGKVFLVISAINIFCFILSIIFKNPNIELISRLSLVILMYSIVRIFNKIKLEQDAKKLIDKLSE